MELDLGGVTLFKWIVPASVEGVWQWEGPEGEIYHLELQQKYQKVTGEIWVDDHPATLQNISLSGANLELSIQVSVDAALRKARLSFEHDAQNPELEWLE